MLNESPSSSSSLSRIITSLKVAALVTVLGTVVIAAEQRIAAVPAVQAVAATSQAASGGATQPATTDYFPAQFPAPTGEISEPVPTF